MDWPEVEISEVCELMVDCVNRTAPLSDVPTPYKMIRTTNVKDGWVLLEEVRCVSEEVYAKWTRRQVPRRGDVILTREAPLGEVGLLRPAYAGESIKICSQPPPVLRYQVCDKFSR